MQTLSSGWTSPFIVNEKVSVIDCRIQLNSEGSSKVVHLDQPGMHPCHQDKTNWSRDELAHHVDDNVGTDPIRPQQTTLGVSIACQTSDIDPIVVTSNNMTPKVIIHRRSRRKGNTFVCLLSTDLE